jgi:hypothetical protein
LVCYEKRFVDFESSKPLSPMSGINIYESGIPIDQAKDLAAQAQGFRNQAHYWAWLEIIYN